MLLWQGDKRRLRNIRHDNNIEGGAGGGGGAGGPGAKVSHRRFRHHRRQLSRNKGRCLPDVRLPDP